MIITDENGFTLLEAMIAVIILGLALLALLRLMPVGLRGGKLAEETTIAALLAQKKIEEARAASTWPPPAVSKTDLGSEGYSNFEYTLDVTDATPPAYLQELTVSVYWPANQPLDHQRIVGFTTYLANPNP